MKRKFLFACLAATVALCGLTPSTAKAHDSGSSGYYVTKVVGYDHCGRPIYRQVWVSTCAPRQSYPSYNSGHSHGSGGSYIHAPGIDVHFGGSSSSHHHHHGR